MVRVKAKTVTVSMRFEQGDVKLMEALQQKTGVKAKSEIVRMGLRSLAREQSVSVR